MITIDQIVDNYDGTITIFSHDDIGDTFQNIIGLSNTPTPTDPLSDANMAFYLYYVESTIPPPATPIYNGP